MKILKVKRSDIKNAPVSPGVYLYYDINNKPIYIGKAKNLRSRLSSYFAGQLERKTAQMINEAIKIKTIITNSEIEALLLEAKLVKKYKPFYNSQLKDDKSPLYIGITKEKYPRVLTLRQRGIVTSDYKYLYGPYLNGVSVKKILRLLRSAFPYSDHKIGKRACVRSQIGLCNPCPNYINTSSTDPTTVKTLRGEYLKNIKKIRNILDGKLQITKNTLTKEMNNFSRHENYEKAAATKKQIAVLNYITNPPQFPIEEYLGDPNLIEDIREGELKDLKNFLNQFISVKTINRIECFDIAHLSGTSPTASMVTFIDGEADKKFYRHFKVNPKINNNDYESMKSILGRRIKHFEKWGTPDLIIVDGGKPQVAAAEILNGGIPVVGIAKSDERLILKLENKFEEKVLPKGAARNLVQRIRNEAHRFARRLHHKQVKKTLLAK